MIKEKRNILTQKEAATFLGTTVGVLNSWRYYGAHGIPYFKLGNRIRYYEHELTEWINKHSVNRQTGDIL